jgi:hypothetical protein
MFHVKVSQTVEKSLKYEKWVYFSASTRYSYTQHGASQRLNIFIFANAKHPVIID